MVANTLNLPPHRPSELFHAWRTEDRDLNTYIGDLRRWMREVNQLGIPHFGEAATRLTALRARLVRHFDQELQTISGLAHCFADTDSAAAQLKARADRDHAAMLGQLDELRQRLNQLEPPFRSWIAAMEEIEAFVRRLSDQDSQAASNPKSTMPVGGRGR